jgi:hypothetical protein
MKSRRKQPTKKPQYFIIIAKKPSRPAKQFERSGWTLQNRRAQAEEPTLWPTITENGTLHRACLHCEQAKQTTKTHLCAACSSISCIARVYRSVYKQSRMTPEWDAHLQALTNLAKAGLPLFQRSTSGSRLNDAAKYPRPRLPVDPDQPPRFEQANPRRIFKFPRVAFAGNY